MLVVCLGRFCDKIRLQPEEMEMITIDDVLYEEADLSDVAKAHVERINQLRQQLVQLTQQENELKVLISAYANAISQSVKEEDLAE
jgi:hypothetical protein